jgi:hypothetical protein
VRLDGELKKTAAFDIEFPPCPTEQIRTGSVCFGFYKLGDTCPESGVSSTLSPTSCKCTDKGWQC